MAQAFLKIRGIDPLLFRDGRPFTADAGGLTARSLPLPFPTTVAAFARTQIGRAEGRTWNDRDCEWAHTIPVHGPLLMRERQPTSERPGAMPVALDGHVVTNGKPTGLATDSGIMLPAPLDCLLTAEGYPIRLMPLETWPPADDAGCDMPPDGLRPLRLTSEYDGKPATGFNYWPAEQVLGWLDGNAPGKIEKISGLPEEERVGIAMEGGQAKEGHLYATRLRAFGERVPPRPNQSDGSDVSDRSDRLDTRGTGTRRYEYSLVARVKLPNGTTVRNLPAGTLGGERRLTGVECFEDVPGAATPWVNCPPALKEALRTARRVRMVLATPACFSHGWKPGWIDDSGTGREHLPAGIGKVKLKLVAAAVGRRVAVSGWGLRQGQPRDVRWLAPAGSVYFFDVEGDLPGDALLNAWMKPMSDELQDQRDGLGLALWGTW